MSKELSLNDLKKEYEKIQKEHGLPGFDELNKDFCIEKISDFETDFLLREVRKIMADRFSNYLRFIEAILNPVNVPMFIFSIVKSLSIEEKNKLTEVYKKLAEIEVELIGVDIEYVEKKEAEFIKQSFLVWQKIKKDILEIVRVIKKNWGNKLETNNKGYFG